MTHLDKKFMKLIRECARPKNVELARQTFVNSRYEAGSGMIILESWENIVKLARSSGLRSKKRRFIRKRAKAVFERILAVGILAIE